MCYLHIKAGVSSICCHNCVRGGLYRPYIRPSIQADRRSRAVIEFLLVLKNWLHPTCYSPQLLWSSIMTGTWGFAPQSSLRSFQESFQEQNFLLERDTHKEKPIFVASRIEAVFSGHVSWDEPTDEQEDIVWTGWQIVCFAPRSNRKVLSPW